MVLTNPVPSGRLTDRYGPRGFVPGVGDLGFHTGDDVAAPTGTPILAAHDGVVSRKWWDAFANGAGAGGNMVEIRGDDGLLTRYAHMQAQSPLPVGARVTAGQTVVGHVGTSGASTGAHLHFEVLAKGSFTNPWALVTSTTTPTTSKELTLPALIQNHDKSVGFVSDAGMLDPISTMREVDALKMTGIVGGIVPFKDGTVWNALVARTSRLKAQQAQVDPAKIAAQVAALMVGPVVAALSEAGQLTQADVEAAVAKVTKEMLAKAAA